MSITLSTQRQNKSLLRGASTATISAILFLTATPTISAQTSNDDAPRFEDEIIVTARKTEESLQDVSLAITAFTKDDIKKRNLTELENVALQTPGFTFEDFSNGGFGAPVIRGTSQILVSQLEQNVSVFYDGIYIPRQYAFDTGLADVQRIEVVKGPQSALYGANSFSGAINYVAPDRNLNDITGNLSAGVGTDGLFEFSGNLNLPLIQDKFALRAAVAHTQFDGEFDNNFPGAENAPDQGTDEDIGGWNRESYTIGGTVKLGGLQIDADYTQFDVLNEVRPANTITNLAQLGAPPGTSDFNCGFGSLAPFIPPTNRLFCGELPTSFGPGISGTEGLTTDPRSFLESETEIVKVELNYEFSDNFDFTYLFGDVNSDIFAVGAADRDPVAGSAIFIPPATFLTGAALSFTPDGGIDYSTHEVRFNYESDNGITALLGGYLLNGEDREQTTFGFVPQFQTIPVADIAPVTESTAPTGFDVLDTEIRAIFGRISVPITDQFTVSAEARYSETDKEIDANVVAADLTESIQNLVNEDRAFTPRVNLDWNVTDDVLLYASFAQGVKSGGINTSTVNLSEEETFFSEDENTSWEIGAKNVFLDGRATVNLAAYIIDWEDLQVGVLPATAGLFTGGIVENLGSAQSRGIELDGTFNLLDSISFNYGLSLIDAEYDEGTISSRGTFVCDDIVCNADGDVSGNNLARVPTVQWNVGAQYDGQFGDFDYFARVDVAGQNEQNVSEFNISTIEGRTLTNLRGGISKGPIRAEVWVTNLFDEIYVANSFFIVNAFTQQYTATLGAGRRVGVELSYDF